MSSVGSRNAFFRRYQAQGLTGISSGLATIAPVSSPAQATSNPSNHVGARSFAERLSNVRSVISECIEECGLNAQIRPLDAWVNVIPFENIKPPIY
jgi:hypothetical protein